MSWIMSTEMLTDEFNRKALHVFIGQVKIAEIRLVSLGPTDGRYSWGWSLVGMGLRYGGPYVKLGEAMTELHRRLREPKVNYSDDTPSEEQS